MTKHTHGKMDIGEHEKTFAGFVRITVYTVVAIIVLLLFLAAVNG